MVTRAIWSSLVFGVFGAGLLFGCSGKVVGKSGGETNWLAKCATDGQCTGDAMCICGVCSKTCTSNAVCPANGTCVRSGTRAFSATCGSATVTGLCVEKCPTNGCEGPQACTENACVPASLRNGDASTGGTASQGGTAGNAGMPVGANGGASNVGGSGGRDAGAQRDAGSDGGHPNYGSWTAECPVGDPGGVGFLFSSSCAFGLGTCVPRDTALSNPFGPMLGHDTCKAPLYCAPSQQFFEGGVVTWAQCRTMAGLLVSLEGRCVPWGLAPVPASQYRLTNETCPTSFVCVPCYGPIDGTATGACNGPGDYPRENVPSSPKTCGVFDNGPQGGLCAPRADVESWDFYLSFAQDDCAKGDVCAPTSLVRQGGHCFQRCTTSLDALGPEYAPGACLPAYLIRDLGRVAPATLTRGTCALGELCSPCANPQMPGISTGACD